LGEGHYFLFDQGGKEVSFPSPTFSNVFEEFRFRFICSSNNQIYPGKKTCFELYDPVIAFLPEQPFRMKAFFSWALVRTTNAKSYPLLSLSLSLSLSFHMSRWTSEATQPSHALAYMQTTLLLGRQI
jgi:hypothetical protein